MPTSVTSGSPPKRNLAEPDKIFYFRYLQTIPRLEKAPQLRPDHKHFVNAAREAIGYTEPSSVKEPGTMPGTTPETIFGAVSVTTKLGTMPGMTPGAMRSREPQASGSRRVEAIDFARGLAVTLMILSHGVKGLLSFEQIPAWGLVPIHLITKFSSSLFILVFGISMAVAVLPRVGTDAWPSARNRLLWRGLVILFWYKVLTIVEMMPMASREDILDTLFYRAFPVYVEILGFYAIALVWVPLTLPLWRRLPLEAKLCVPVLFAALSFELSERFDFWGSESLRAILVEHPKHYTWGQLARAPLVFSGLLLGEVIAREYWRTRSRLLLALAIGGVGAVLLGLFFIDARPGFYDDLVAIAKNEGKHPPQMDFMLFSVGGALALLAVSLLGGERLARIVRPITTIGRNALQSFIFHIFVLFVFYRYLLDYWRSVSYSYALLLTLILIALTAVWTWMTRVAQRFSSPRF
ncbi:MAG: DUF1624 domain-containing protein [Bdellovibrionaceae bacterium]|nr:DUF1624 domain-containing protein [Pseudobdellovibrionaceae bacterium]